MNSKDNATDKFSGTVSRSHHIIFHCEYYGFHVPQSIHDIANGYSTRFGYSANTGQEDNKIDSHTGTWQ